MFQVGGVKKFSSTSVDLCSGFSGSSANVLRTDILLALAQVIQWKCEHLLV